MIWVNGSSSDVGLKHMKLADYIQSDGYKQHVSEKLLTKTDFTDVNVYADLFELMNVQDILNILESKPIWLCFDCLHEFYSRKSEKAMEIFNIFDKSEYNKNYLKIDICSEIMFYHMDFPHYFIKNNIESFFELFRSDLARALLLPIFVSLSVYKLDDDKQKEYKILSKKSINYQLSEFSKLSRVKNKNCSKDSD